MGLTIIILPLGLISSLIIKKMNEKSFDNLSIQREKMKDLWKVFHEGIRGLIPIKLHHYDDIYLNKIESNGFSLKNVQIKQGKLESISYFLTSSLFMVTIGIILIFSSLLVAQNAVSVGGLTAILMYNHMLTDPLLNLLQINSKLMKLFVSMKRVMKLDEIPKEKQINMIDPDEIELKNITYSIEEKVILENINIKLRKPSSVGIIGQTGSGKTTLVNLITNLYTIQKGEIIYKKENHRIYGNPRVSYMLQDEYLFDDTIKNNIFIGNPYLTKERYQHLIKICKLEDVMIHHPNAIGENGNKLSGGERKRVLLARTLAESSAGIYIFDELSSGLDQKTFQEIFDEIEIFLKDKIRIYIEHNTAISHMTDTIIPIDKA